MFRQISPSYSVDPITNVYLLALSSDDSNIAEKFGDLENFVMRNVQYVKKTYLKKLILIPNFIAHYQVDIMSSDGSAVLPLLWPAIPTLAQWIICATESSSKQREQSKTRPL